jgi:hypothetical protein
MGAYPGSLTAQGRIEEDLKAQRVTQRRRGMTATCAAATRSSVSHFKATDGDIGHLEDLLVDDHTWAIRHLIVNTSWWGRQRVLIAPHSIKDVSWSEAKVSVDLTRQAVRDAPAYAPAAQVDRQSEPAISGHHGRPGRSTTKTRQHRPPSSVHHAVGDDVDAGSHEGSP